MAVAKVLIASGRLKCFQTAWTFFPKSGCWCGRVGGFVGEKHLTVEVTVNLGHVEGGTFGRHGTALCQAVSDDSKFCQRYFGQ